MRAAEAGRKRLAWALSPAAVIVGAVTLVGMALRLATVGQSPFADELSTYWIIESHQFLEVLEVVHSDAEITPPLFFATAELATLIDLSPEMMRLPSLLAGLASIPLVYLLGARTLGRPAGVVAATLVALSPFMIFYSTEARGYALMMALVLAASLSLLNALETRRTRWWAAYAVLSAACMYTHYTAAFALAAQALWALWAHPEARREILFANLGAVALFGPWLSGLLADFGSPTTEILDKLAPFDAFTVRFALEHWLIGYPSAAAIALGDLGEVPGLPAIVLVTLGIALATTATLASGNLRERLRGLSFRSRGALVFALAVALPLGTALASAFSTNLFTTRNLGASLPAVALLAGALVTRGSRPIAIAATTLLCGGFLIGAARMMESEVAKPDYAGVAEMLRAQPQGTVAVDSVFLTPGPLAPLDVELDGDRQVLRINAPSERDHPFTIFDETTPAPEVARQAVTAAAGEPIVLVAGRMPSTGFPRAVERFLATLPAGYAVTGKRTFPGVVDLVAFTIESRTG